MPIWCSADQTKSTASALAQPWESGEAELLLKGSMCRPWCWLLGLGLVAWDWLGLLGIAWDLLGCWAWFSCCWQLHSHTSSNLGMEKATLHFKDWWRFSIVQLKYFHFGVQHCWTHPWMRKSHVEKHPKDRDQAETVVSSQTRRNEGVLRPIATQKSANSRWFNWKSTVINHHQFFLIDFAPFPS